MTLLGPEELRSRWRSPLGARIRLAVAEQLSRGSALLKPLLEKLPGAAEVGDAMDLRGIELSGLKLHGLKLSWARLDFAAVEGSTLAGAQLDRAALTGASFRQSDLRGASMVAVRAVGSCWDNALLERADLTAANLAQASLRRTSLVGACLQAATLGNANLRGADLSGAELAQCDFEGAHVASVRWNRRGVNARRAALAMELGCPSFADVLEQYMKVLRAEPEAMLDVEAAVETSPDWAMEVGRLLQNRNWRIQVIGAAALVMSPEPHPSLLQELWPPIERGTWVVPQLLAAAYLRDEAFEEKALRLLPSAVPKARGSALELLRECGHPAAAGAWRPDDDGALHVRRWLEMLRKLPADRQARWLH